MLLTLTLGVRPALEGLGAWASSDPCYPVVHPSEPRAWGKVTLVR